MLRNLRSRGTLFALFMACYAAGTGVAAFLAAMWGGSPLLLFMYSLAVGAPFFVSAAVLGLIFYRHLLLHPLAWCIAAPIVTGVVWFGGGFAVGDLFNGPAIGLYAMFCATCCSIVFYIGLRWRPIELDRGNPR